MIKKRQIIACLAALLLFAFFVSAKEEGDWTVERAKSWIKSRVWDNGWSLSPDPSVDPVAFATQYTRNKALWDKAFLFLKEQNLSALPVGDYVIEAGRCWATVSEYVPKTADQANLESHERFIDLQYTLWGNEKMGLAETEAKVRMPYNEKRDVAFYIPGKITYFATSADRFFLFFPGDKHQPSVLNGQPVRSRKIVIKIEYKK